MFQTFFNTKIQTLCKKQDNLRYVFLYKNPRGDSLTRESLRAKILQSTKRSFGGWDALIGRAWGGRQATLGRGDRSGGGNTDEVGTPTSPGSLAPDTWVIQVCVRTYSAACSGYP